MGVVLVWLCTAVVVAYNWAVAVAGLNFNGTLIEADRPTDRLTNQPAYLQSRLNCSPNVPWNSDRGINKPVGRFVHVVSGLFEIGQ